jgi:hypothetical protein
VRAAWRERTPEQDDVVRGGDVLQLCREIGIRRTTGVQRPLHGAVLGLRDGGAAHPVALRIRAHVDQLHARVRLQQRERFLGRDGTRVRLAGRASPGVGENLVGRAHVIFSI